MSRVHTVEQGESVDSIAARFGIPPEAIQSHPDNQKLLQKRKATDILRPGDELALPASVGKRFECEPGKAYRFIRRTPSEPFELRFIDSRNEPIADVGWILQLQTLDGANLPTLAGTTDSDGVLRHDVPVTASGGYVLLGDEDEKLPIKIRLRHLDPLDDLRGVQGRLGNLGYGSGPVDGELGDITREAVRAFQQDHELEPLDEADSVIDDTTLEKLEELHGS